jgi:hypothetical protein
MIVNGYLNFKNSSIESLGDLDLRDSIEEFFGKLKIINGSLFLSRTNNITKLPKNFKITGDLYLRESKIISLPDDLNISGDIMAYESLITKKYIKENYPNLFIKCDWSF